MHRKEDRSALHHARTPRRDAFSWPNDDDALRRFGDRLVARTLDRSEWTHATHLACAIYFIAMRDDLVAERDMPVAIRAHNEAVGIANDDSGGYHATITLASLAVARGFLWRYPPRTSPSVVARALIRSRFGDACWVQAHWSAERLWSRAARRGWLVPNREPLPAQVLRSGTVSVDGTMPGLVPQVRALLIEYQAALGVDLSFQGFGDELATLPGHYAAPEGALIAAFADAMLAGCCAVRPLANGACELKRLWVRPDFRHRGIGQQLIGDAIQAARGAGHDRMVLDTMPHMDQARRLYRRLGFATVEPYGAPALPGTIWLGRPIVRD